MRIFDSKIEAQGWCRLREGYTWKCVTTPKKKPDLEAFGEAPF